MATVVGSCVLGARLFQHASDKIWKGAVGKFIDEISQNLVPEDDPPPLTEARVQSAKDEVMATYGQTTCLEIERIIKSSFHDPTDDELSFTDDSFWKGFISELLCS